MKIEILYLGKLVLLLIIIGAMLLWTKGINPQSKWLGA